eukprot:CAMPEP_0198321962 /NCGR_PEP_ID=MMETSP1450-20131203/10566_1 /TAXON_ID=753684 ORGANISM="Madagascaria erythrocladiodes, Strain CCMP3234" /NCGR_SAMPLE_ID=MMETSP1450 /ASSEMBLY_ACC=CAM_ASM_001115 /LENGTH=254 /DNA_ID=CAMNT_0044025547 /DNA_START=96 /DNA_END=857 /DNA_ORIENTATION=-
MAGAAGDDEPAAWFFPDTSNNGNAEAALPCRWWLQARRGNGDGCRRGAAGGCGYNHEVGGFMRLLDALAAAKTSIDACVFTISSNDLADELLAAHKRGVTVRIVTDNDKAHDRGSDVKRLAEAGIEVRCDATSAHMHHKFCVIDNALVLHGSFNWTVSAVRHNREVITPVRDAAVVAAFAAEFNNLLTNLQATTRDRARRRVPRKMYARTNNGAKHDRDAHNCGQQRTQPFSHSHIFTARSRPRCATPSSGAAA